MYSYIVYVVYLNINIQLYCICYLSQRYIFLYIDIVGITFQLMSIVMYILNCYRYICYYIRFISIL